jgi:hypothetical protein
MHPESVADHRREDRPRQQARLQQRSELVAAPVMVFQHRHQRPGEHQQQEGPEHGADQGRQGPSERSGAGERHHRRQQQPAQHVIHCSGADRQLAQGLPHQSPFPQDAAQHREGGDRHRHPHEQESGQAAFPGQQLRGDSLQGAGQGDAQTQGQQHAHQRQAAGQGQLSLQQGWIHLQPHQEHEQDQPQLAQQVELAGDAFRSEQGLLELGCQGPQHRRPEHDAPQDLPQNPGLPQAAQQFPQQLTHHHDQGDVHQHQGQARGRGGHGEGNQGVIPEGVRPG